MKYFFIVFISLLLGVLLGFGASKADMKQLGAMEVYKGNTKMQYTIIDSVKVDSCVIFLNK